MLALALRPRKRVWTTADAVARDVAARQATPAPHAPPRSMARSAHIAKRTVAGWPVYTLTPRPRISPARPSAGVVVYLHGGGWIHEISYSHWATMRDLMEATGTSFVVPIYPVAPGGTAREVVPVTVAMIRAAIAQWGAAQVTVMGDSAGGNLVLVCAQQLRAAGHELPGRSVLISPAFDFTFSDARVAGIAARDPFLAVAGLTYSGTLWAGDLPMTDPLVNPLYGDLAGLSPLVVFTGTHDICHPDAVALATRAREVGVDVTYHEVAGVPHVYPLLPTPEGKVARQILADLLAGPA